MKIDEFMKLNNLKTNEDLRLYFRSNLLNGAGVCAAYLCPQCGEMLGDASEIVTHKCDPPNHKSTYKENNLL